MAMPAAKDPKTVKATKEEAYKSYHMAGHYEFQNFFHLKMAAVLLKSRRNNC